MDVFTYSRPKPQFKHITKRAMGGLLRFVSGRISRWCHHMDTFSALLALYESGIETWGRSLWRHCNLPKSSCLTMSSCPTVSMAGTKSFSEEISKNIYWHGINRCDLSENMIWYDMLRYDMIWYEVTWNDMTGHDVTVHDMISYNMIWNDMILYDMI